MLLDPRQPKRGRDEPVALPVLALAHAEGHLGKVPDQGAHLVDQNGTLGIAWGELPDAQLEEVEQPVQIARQRVAPHARLHRSRERSTELVREPWRVVIQARETWVQLPRALQPTG